MKPRIRWIVISLLIAGIVVALRQPVEEKARAMKQQIVKIQPWDLSGHSDAGPGRPLHLLFIHHSCGGQLLAAPGIEKNLIGGRGLYSSHPNGGGLRSRLEQDSYLVHEASYGSEIGERTDVFDWLPKFRTQMDHILACQFQDIRHPENIQNQIVLFKSCYPNSAFIAEGTAPGNPNGPDLTVWNAKASYTALLEEFRKTPGVLFVALTAPPLAPKTPAQPLWKHIAKKFLKRGGPSLKTSAPLARQFNSWLTDKNGWLKNYELPNVVVFDYYDILTGRGASDLCAFPTGGNYDSHPSREGNQEAAEAFVPFLNRAVRRAGLVK
jgi:hypothetical protein